MRKFDSFGLLAMGAAMVIAGESSAQQTDSAKWALVGSLSVQPHTRQLEIPFWQERVPEVTDGALTVELRGWDALGLKGTETWHFVQEGTFDGGVLSSSRASGDAPITEGPDLAGLAPEIEDLYETLEAYEPALEEWYEKKYNMKLVGLWQYPPQMLLCRDPVDSISDVSGRKVRVSSGSQATLMESQGATAIYMASPEVLPALQNGVIDCGITSALSGYKQGWHEVVKHLYPLAINWNPQGHIFNLASWNALTPDVQQVLETELREYALRSREHMLYEADLGIACMTGNGECPEGEPGDMKLAEVQAGDRDLLSNALREKVAPEWANRCGSECADVWNETIGKIAGFEIHP